MQNAALYREAMTTAWRLVGERGMMTVNFAPWTETVGVCVFSTEQDSMTCGAESNSVITRGNKKF